ncbi:MAG TPA: 2-succinyl-5-enolpyruvyl-6-hydroxy-3-cyclohexene-1-carboxylic-acid synthase, partial [Pseudolysinimonas sp.]|nr:2-succinyl-5-enolpyruvyl-6-hydroxy-3-cyclohexene-1-carboxylic-acid synthase [Pseudolysinimonas sp.]
MTRPATDGPAPSSTFAVALLEGFIAGGVRDLVLSPGSRSQALALAAAEFERAGLLRLRVRIDERSAGFLALGLAIESRRPVLLVTTSGSAVAHLHPAVLEAAHSGVPLIVLSADRPAELRGIGANQTTTQPGMFGDAAPTVDVPAPEHGPGLADRARGLAARTLAELRGPAHINLGFREPLSSPVAIPQVVRGDWSPPPARSFAAASLVPSFGTVVVAGTGAGEQAERAARDLGAPLLAEVSSGARFGPQLVAAYRELLRADDFGGRVERVIVFGHPTLSREVPELIQRPGVQTIVVRGPGREDYNPGHRVTEFVDAVRVAEAPDDPGNERTLRGLRSWVGPWVAASREIIQGDDPL